MGRAGRFVEVGPGAVDLGVFEVVPRTAQGEGKDVTSVAVRRNRVTRLEAGAHHPQSSVEIDVQNLHVTSVANIDKRGLVFTPVQGLRNEVEHGLSVRRVVAGEGKKDS